jgi:tetratricopeptide (TPR) repeat protein
MRDNPQPQAGGRPPAGRTGRRAGRPIAAALLGLVCLAGASPAATNPPAAASATRAPESARDYYNEGTKHFREGKLREAETSLQTAVARNEEQVQPAALYNLGHVRFKQGADALKDAPKAGAAKARADAACETGSGAIQAAKDALAGNDVDAITRAYLRGRGARKELKAAMDAVKKAMEAHGAVLARWQRASGDFKGAHELQPSLADAQANGEVVDRCIAALVDQQEMLAMAMQCMGEKRGELKSRMQDLKKRLPDGPQKEDEGEDDEDEDQDKPPKQPSHGQQEKEVKEGKEMVLTWEEAMRLLESLKLDANRKLPMGDKETANPKQRRGKEW